MEQVDEDELRRRYYLQIAGVPTGFEALTDEELDAAEALERQADIKRDWEATRAVALMRVDHSDGERRLYGPYPVSAFRRLKEVEVPRLEVEYAQEFGVGAYSFEVVMLMEPALIVGEDSDE